jgi:hypothetical protein
MKDAAKHCLLALALCMYAISCFCPALESVDPDGLVEETYDGWEALFVGWITLLIPSPFWLANPLFFSAICFLQSREHPVAAHRTAVVAVFCALWIFRFYAPFPTNLPVSARTDFEEYIRVGAWLWLASILTIWIRTVIDLWESRSRHSP